MLKATLKSLAARKLRLALTAVSVVLGVGFIAGTFVLTDTMNRAFDEVFADAARGVDVYVRSPEMSATQSLAETATVPEDLIDEVQAVKGVKRADGTVSGYAQFVSENGKPVTTGGAPTLGVSWMDRKESAITIREGRAPRGPSEVMVDAATSRSQGYELGDRVKILFEGGVREFTVVGVAGFGEADNLAGATMAVFDLPTAQKLFNKRGQFDAIEVVSDGSLATPALIDAIEEVLPERYVATPAADVAAEQAQSIQDELGFFTTALLVFAAVAVLVGAFIIFNTFSIVVAQRTREFALLRSLGASGRQVMASVLLEAGVVGLVGAAAGLGTGIGLAWGLRALLEAFGIDLPGTDLQVLPRTVVVSLVVGVTVTLAASLVPARKAGRVPPMAALRSLTPGPQGWSRRRTLAGLALLGGGAVTLLSGSFSTGRTTAAVAAGALMVFFGTSVLTPLIAGPLARAVGTPAARLFGIRARLARENAARNPKRTAATASALMIGLALVSVVSIMASSIKATSAKVLDESVKADLILISGGMMPEGPGLPREVTRRIASLPSVDVTATMSFGTAQTGGGAARITALDLEPLSLLTSFDVVGTPDPRAVRRGVLVEKETARARSLEVGDEVAFRFSSTGRRVLPVAGIFESGGLVSGNYVISTETYKENFRSHSVDVMLVSAAPGTPLSTLRAQVDRTVARHPNVEVQNREAFKQKQARQIDQLLGLVTALLGLALLIALFGITNTLALSVFERVREIGLLRAVGALRGQIRSAIRWEAVVVAVMGALLGAGVGVFLGWALVSSLRSEGVTEFVVPFADLAGYVAAAGVAGVVAALPPARRAGRLNLLEAIATE